MDIQKELSTFCQNIYYLRKKYHLSEKSMAMLIDISEEDLRLVESGSLPDSVTVHTLVRLHKVFDLSVDTFFAGPLEQHNRRDDPCGRPSIDALT